MFWCVQIVIFGVFKNWPFTYTNTNTHVQTHIRRVTVMRLDFDIRCDEFMNTED